MTTQPATELQDVIDPGADGDIEADGEADTSAATLQAEAPGASNSLQPSTSEHESRRWSKLARRVAAGCAAILLLAMIAATVMLGMHVKGLHRTDQARTQSLQAASTLLPKVLSYDHQHLEADLSAASTVLTGRFKTDFQQLVDSAVRPAAVKRQITTLTTVQSAGVVSNTDQHAVILAFINQKTTAVDQQTPKIEGARLRVELQNENGAWLISAINPL